MKHLHRRVERIAAALSRRHAPVVSGGERCATCGQLSGAVRDSSSAALLECLPLRELQELVELRDRLVALYTRMGERGECPTCPACGLVRQADLARRANADELTELEQVMARLGVLAEAINNRWPGDAAT
jgi:hypothetical protein